MSFISIQLTDSSSTAAARAISGDLRVHSLWPTHLSDLFN